MEDYIYDGELHALNSKWAYILKKYEDDTYDFNMNSECLDLYRKYAEYLYACDKEKVIEYLMKIFQHHLTFKETTPGTQLVFRPPQSLGPLAQFATLALKFERSKNDTLVTP